MSIKKATLDEHICGELNNVDGVVSGKQEKHTINLFWAFRRIFQNSKQRE